MDTTFVLALLAVLATWGGVGWLMYRWGPGRVRRKVQCPKQHVQAEVEVLQTEGDWAKGGWGSLRQSDVLACSLFPLGQLTCTKECILRRKA